MPVTVSCEDQEEVLADEVDLARAKRLPVVVQGQWDDVFRGEVRAHGQRRGDIVRKEPSESRIRFLVPAVLDRGGLQHGPEGVRGNVDGQTFEA